jgi:hypothetical protein
MSIKINRLEEGHNSYPLVFRRPAETVYFQSVDDILSVPQAINIACSSLSSCSIPIKLSQIKLKWELRTWRNYVFCIRSQHNTIQRLLTLELFNRVYTIRNNLH